MMLKMQGCLITPIPFLKMAIYFEKISFTFNLQKICEFKTNVLNMVLVYYSVYRTMDEWDKSPYRTLLHLSHESTCGIFFIPR